MDPGDILLREDELIWVSSAMSAVARDLSGAGRHDLAHSPFWVAIEAALAAAVAAGTASADNEVLSLCPHVILQATVCPTWHA